MLVFGISVIRLMLQLVETDCSHSYFLPFSDWFVCFQRYFILGCPTFPYTSRHWCSQCQLQIGTEKIKLFTVYLCFWLFLGKSVFVYDIHTKMCMFTVKEFLFLLNCAVFPDQIYQEPSEYSCCPSVYCQYCQNFQLLTKWHKASLNIGFLYDIKHLHCMPAACMDFTSR